MIKRIINKSLSKCLARSIIRFGLYWRPVPIAKITIRLNEIKVFIKYEMLNNLFFHVQYTNARKN